MRTTNTQTQCPNTSGFVGTWKGYSERRFENAAQCIGMPIKFLERTSLKPLGSRLPSAVQLAYGYGTTHSDTVAQSHMFLEKKLETFLFISKICLLNFIILVISRKFTDI